MNYHKRKIVIGLITILAMFQKVQCASAVDGLMHYPPINTELQKAINDAVNTYPTVAAAKANIEAVGADLSAAKWARFPSLTVEGLAYRESSAKASTAQDNTTQVTAVVDQPIWTGGVISGNINKASYQQDASVAGLAQAVLDLELQVSQNYFEVKRQQSRLDVLKKSIAEHQSLVDMMQRRVQQEVSPTADLELVKSRLAQIQLQYASASASRNASLQRLRDLVGNTSYEIQSVATYSGITPAFSLDELTSLVLHNSPKLQQLQSEVKVASATADVSKAQLFPKLDMQYSYNDLTGNRVGLVLKSQFSGGLSGVAVSDAARIRQKSTELQLGAAERDIRNQMVADYEDYMSSRNRLSVATGASESAQRISESYMRQFTSGLRTWLDLMNAVRESASASLDAVEASVGTEYSLTRIILRTGMWKADLLGNE